MKKQRLKFDRDFQLWFYTPSHALLLFRSPKRKGDEKRIDILFAAVHALECPTMIKNGLSIQEIERKDWENDHMPADKFHSKLRFFVLTGDGWQGYVVAGEVIWAEDDLAFDKPSSLTMNLDISVSRGLFGS